MQNYYDELVEKQLLNSMLNSPQALVIALTHLEIDVFMGTTTRELYGIIKGLIKKNIAVNRDNLNAEYKIKGEFLPHYFNKPDTVEINDVIIKIDLIKNYAILRSVLNEITTVPAQLDIWNYKNKIMALTAKISEIINQTENGIVEEWELRNKLVNQLNNKDVRKVIKTGYWNIDETISGFSAGNIITIAARPAQGKTSLAMQFAINNKKAGHIVGFLSLEMSNDEIMERIMANELNVPYTDVRDRKIQPEQYAGYADNYDEKIKFVKNQNIKIDQLAPFVRSMVKINGCEIIYIDHLEKLYDHGPQEKKHERLGYIMDKLKTIAQELEIPIVVMQQINREGPNNKGSRPTLENIKSSGAIEEFSDIVFLLHRPESYDRENHEIRGLFEINIAKNRFGPTAALKLTFDPQYMKFTYWRQ